MNASIILLLFLLLSFIEPLISHKCNHNELPNSITNTNNFSSNQNGFEHQTDDQDFSFRDLQEISPEEMRITYSFFDNLRKRQTKNNKNESNQTLNQTKVDNSDEEYSEMVSYTQKVIDTALLYLSKLIKVIPRISPIRSRVNAAGCNEFYPSELTINGEGISDSDLHLIIMHYEGLPGSTVLAKSIVCEEDPKPKIGKVKFNSKLIKEGVRDQKMFHDIVKIAIHEIIHILGFSINSFSKWIDKETGNLYNKSDLHKIYEKRERWGKNNTILLKSEEILFTAENYFNCQSLEGMYLENQGTSGSRGSHWEQDLIYNEVMVSEIRYGNSAVSIFTGALLYDTGYYENIEYNLLDDIQFGKDQGCEFVQQACNSTNTQFNEYFQLNSNENTIYKDGQCNYEQTGISFSSIQGQFSQCQHYSQSNFHECSEIVYSSQFPPRCLQLNLMNTRKQQPKQAFCVETQCNQDSTIITFLLSGGSSVTCHHSGEEILLPTVGQQATTKCPSNFNSFCQVQLGCKNNCSQQGICIKGYCICLKNHAGENCSEYCEYPSVLSDEGQCIDTCKPGQYKQPNNSCGNSCPQSYYQDNSNRVCQICHKRCSSCYGPSQEQCYSCNLGYQLLETSCIQNNCPQNCLNCKVKQKDKCLNCQQGYYLSQHFKCIPICHSSCAQCSESYLSNKCTSCNYGYYLLSTNTCNSCTQPILQKNQSENLNWCLSCLDKTAYKVLANKCVIICDDSCSECFLAKNKNGCISCKKGWYQKGNQCLKCSQKQCTSCKSENECTTCIQGYVLDSSLVCTMQCHQSCSKCGSPLNPKGCIECYDNFKLVEYSCVKCEHPCKTCSINSDKCISCFEGYSLNSKGKCKIISCKQGYFLNQNYQCIACQFPCQQCIKQSHHCLKCVKDYKLIEEKSINSCKKIIPQKNVPEEKEPSQDRNPQNETKDNDSTSQTKKEKDSSSKTQANIPQDEPKQNTPPPQEEIEKNTKKLKDDKGKIESDTKQEQASLPQKEDNEKKQENQIQNGNDEQERLNNGNCHWTCSSCLVKDSFIGCISCTSNRIGTCECKRHSWDYNVPICTDTHYEWVITVGAILFACIVVFSIISSIIIGIKIKSAQNLILIFQFCQNLSLLSLINSKQSLIFEMMLGVQSFTRQSYSWYIHQHYFASQQEQEENNNSNEYNSDDIKEVEQFNKKLVLENEIVSYTMLSKILLSILVIAQIIKYFFRIASKFKFNNLNKKYNSIINNSPILLAWLFQQQLVLSISYTAIQQQQKQQQSIETSIMIGSISFLYVIIYMSTLYSLPFSQQNNTNNNHPNNNNNCLQQSDSIQQKDKEALSSDEFEIELKNRVYLSINIIRMLVVGLIISFLESPIIQSSLISIIHLGISIFFKVTHHSKILEELSLSIIFGLQFISEISIQKTGKNEKYQLIFLAQISLMIFVLLNNSFSLIYSTFHQSRSSLKIPSNNSQKELPVSLTPQSSFIASSKQLICSNNVKVF